MEVGVSNTLRLLCLRKNAPDIHWTRSWVSLISGVNVFLTSLCQEIEPRFLVLPATIMSGRTIFIKPPSMNCRIRYCEYDIREERMGLLELKFLLLIFLNKLKYLNWSVFDVDNFYIRLHIFWKAGCSNKTLYELKCENERIHKGRTATVSSKSQQPSEKLLL